MDMEFPTIDPSDPLKLSEEEEELLHTLTLSFCHSALSTSILNSLYSNGSMYKCCNSNLLYHGCIPMKRGRQL